MFCKQGFPKLGALNACLPRVVFSGGVFFHRHRYTQFQSQDSGLFGPNPWKVLAPSSNYLSKKSFWATQPLEVL